MNHKINFIGDFHSIKIADEAILEIGSWVEIRSFSSLEVFPGAKLSLGDSVFINEHCTIRCAFQITIGDETMIGDGVRIYDQDHMYSSYQIDRRTTVNQAVTIGKKSWIGANVVILKGVTIGDNVIIGAGTLVTRDIPSNSIVYGQGNLIVKPRKRAEDHVFILTASDQIHHLDYLLEHLPEVDFHIAAPTNMSQSLLNYNNFQNCHLYTRFYGEAKYNSMLKKIDVYLDINHGREVDNIVNKAIKNHKPVLSFIGTTHDPNNDHIELFPTDSPDEMIGRIKGIIERKNKQ